MRVEIAREQDIAEFRVTVSAGRAEVLESVRIIWPEIRHQQMCHWSGLNDGGIVGTEFILQEGSQQERGNDVDLPGPFKTISCGYGPVKNPTGCGGR